MAPSQAAMISFRPGATPGGARDLDEGAALRRGLELALARRHQGAGELGDPAQRCAVLRQNRAVRVREKDAVAKA